MERRITDAQAARRGPESSFYDRLKGKPCRLLLSGPEGYSVVKGVLLWVDRYTLGMRVACEGEGFVEVLYNKAWVISLKKGAFDAGSRGNAI